MIDLRTFAGLALAGFLLGLTGCANQRGDLGAEREEPSPIVRTEQPAAQPSDTAAVANAATPAGEVVDLDAKKAIAVKQEPAAESVAVPELKEERAELVSLKPAQPIEPEAKTVAAAPEKPAVPENTNADPKAEPKAGETPPPPPPPKPGEETPQQRAERLLKDAERLAGVEAQGRQQEAEAAYQAGLKLFNDLEYEEARKYFEKAVRLNPAHAGAQQKLHTVGALLGIHANVMREKIMELERAQRVQVQEQMAVLAQSLEEGRRLEERGSQTAIELAPAEKEKALAEQLTFLQRAKDGYSRVRELLNYMPPSFELPGVRAQVDAALARVRDKIAAKQDELNFLKRTEAQRIAQESRQREDDAFKLKIRKLLDQVKDLYDKQAYRQAEKLAQSVLVLDPLSSEAEGWKNKARGAYHTREAADAKEKQRWETEKSWEQVEENNISYAQQLIYPPNWDQISRRAESSALGKGVAKEESWKADIRKRLQRKVTFEFVDTPLDEAISFLRSMANVTMIIDPKVLAGGAPAINLRVQDMSLDLALEWILKLADLEYALRDSAIYIAKGTSLIEAVELRIYDVSDLTQTIQDFPGWEMELVTGGNQGGGGGGGGGGGAAGGAAFTGPAKTAPTLTNIADMIRNRVRPESWDPALGTSIEERAGKLVVMQRPEVHALINKLLSDFRATQKMMINIESRFLTIREAYLEDMGVEFQGLDPNILRGDFGDVRRLGGMVQPRAPAATDAIPPNVPFPGLVGLPSRVSGGSLSEVGSIVNHTINFFTNDPDTISGNDRDNSVRQGGFSGQFTVLNNTQLQAFIRALAVRENQTTLIAPRLTVFNTQRANMFVARQQSYVADYEISGDSYDPTIRQFLVGVVLDVKPIVSSDRRYVTMELRPTVTELVNFTTRQIDAFSVNSGANINILVQLAFPIQFPELSIRRVRTTCTCPDGGIIMLGGLYRNVRFHAENGVPFMSDLPVIGRLFRWNTVDNAKSNLAILVSPRIILFNEEEEKL
ncbi:MAG TPA: hypothetical protein VGP72_14875 [Planctomycetota bacterium]|jgi:general secretion pathway protein D